MTDGALHRDEVFLIHEHAKQSAAARRALATVKVRLARDRAVMAALEREHRPTGRVRKRIARLEAERQALERVLWRYCRYERLDNLIGG